MAYDRMSPQDVSFLHMEDDVSHMHVGSVATFEGPFPGRDAIMQMMAGKLPLVPRYRQVVRSVPMDLGRPVWVDDEHFNLEYHIRHTALPKPGGEAELRRLVGRVMSQQLDRAKPLWEIWVAEGLGSGEWAMISKTHHCMIDGVSGTDLMSIIMDKTPEPSPPVPDTWVPQAAPSAGRLAAAALVDLVRSPYEQLRALRSTTRVPRQAVQQLQDVGRGLTTMSRLLQPTPESFLSGPIGPHRRYDWTARSVDDIKAIRSSLGGTFNDVVLAAITRGFRDLIQSRGESTERVVRSLVPVSTRPRDASGRAVGDGTVENKVSALFAELPVDISDPVERLRSISAQMDHLKERKQAVAGEALVALSGFAPPMLLAMGTRAAARANQRNINTVTTNVPGPQSPLYAAGRKMLTTYPLVPLRQGMRVGVAIFSYNGRVHFGVAGDYDTVPDVDVLTRGIDAGMDEMLAAAGVSRSRATTSRPRTGGRTQVSA